MNTFFSIIRVAASFIIFISIFFAICAVSKLSMAFFNVIFTNKQKGKVALGLKEGIELAKSDFKKFIILFIVGLLVFYIPNLFI